MTNSINIQLERLTKDEIKNNLELSKVDFNELTEQFICDFSEKLSRFANFVTCRNSKGQIVGIIAFYSNISPEAFITHVWVLNDMRGQGICGRMLDIVLDLCVRKHFKYIGLEVRHDNFSAINAYIKYGFKKIKLCGDKYRMSKELSISN